MSANTIERTAGRDGLLRLAMRADAVISGLFGLAGLAGWIAEFDGAPAKFAFSMAVFLAAYGVIVFGLAALPSVRRTGVGVAMVNLLYAVAAVVLVLTEVFPFTASGLAFTLATCVYTLIFAAVQYIGCRRANS